ncbi:MAG TPA: sigma-70 family RNA polymerase sigma factor [Kofleriaceae bacterium]|nr:sigma-70 family RNA polymerase sigma factor [Kofleriaceae bacterium]
MDTRPTLGPADRDYVYAVARRVVHGADADDVAQDALLLAHRHRDSFRGHAQLRTWLYRIAMTAAFGYLRKRRRSRELLEGTVPGDEPVDPQPSPEATVAAREVAVIAHRLVAALAPKYRDVVMLRIDHSEDETAARLGISVANVKIRAHRARAQLHEAFAW